MAQHHQLERRRTQVIRRLAQDETPVQIAQWLASRYGIRVSEQGVRAFRQRHASEIAALRTRALERAAEAAGLTQAERLERLDWLAVNLEGLLFERGFLWPEPHGSERTVLKAPTAVIRELREIYKQIAEERGERMDRQAINNPLGADYGGNAAGAIAAAQVVVNVTGSNVEQVNADRAMARRLLDMFTLPKGPDVAALDEPEAAG